MILDDIDRRLLDLLRADARQPISSLAVALDVSPETARSRLDRLVEDGVIEGFTVLVKAGAEQNVIRAITLVEVAGRGMEKVVKRLREFPEVRIIHSTSGQWDIVLEIEAAALAEFERFLRQIRLVEGIASTETSILLSTWKMR
jgi:DNA-binding Lrp family transcriptional regulator